MTTVKLPLRQDALVFGFTTSLGGLSYQFTFYFMQTDQNWYFDLADATGVKLLSGIKVVLGTFLGASTFAGRLFAVDLSNQDRPPGPKDLGDRVVIFYVS